LLAQAKAVKQFSIIAIPLVVAGIGFPLAYSSIHSFALTRDTRLLASHWVQENLPVGSTVVVDWSFYNPPLSTEAFKVIQLAGDQQLFADPSKKRLAAIEADYLILSSLFYERFLNNSAPRNNTSIKIRSLLASSKPIKTFSNPAFAYGFHNPSIRIYDLRNG